MAQCRCACAATHRDGVGEPEEAALADNAYVLQLGAAAGSGGDDGAHNRRSDACEGRVHSKAGGNEE